MMERTFLCGSILMFSRQNSRFFEVTVIPRGRKNLSVIGNFYLYSSWGSSIPRK